MAPLSDNRDSGDEYTESWVSNDSEDYSPEVIEPVTVEEGQPFLPEHLLQAWGRTQQGLWIPSTFHRNALDLPADLDYDTWDFIGTTLRDIGDAAPWWLGDWLNYGEAQYGEMYSQALEHTDYAYGSLANMKSVAKVFPAPTRRPSLSWSIHQAVSSVMRADPEAANIMLDQAMAEGLKKEDVQAIVNEWWFARKGTQSGGNGGSGGNERGEPTGLPAAYAVSEAYVHKLEDIAKEFAKIRPYLYGSCQFCGVVALDDVLVGDHDSVCKWRQANEMFGDDDEDTVPF